MLLRLAITLFGVAALLPTPALAGPINPPAGPVAPTGKTLTEVEPRIAVNAQNTPGDATSAFRITQPGSYYLTGNVLGESGKHGIEIASGVVTLDLNGFALIGVTGSLNGVHMTSLQQNIAVRNGHIRSWGGSGMLLAVDSGHIERITSTGNTSWGIRNSTTASSIRIEACEVNFNGGGGIDGSNATHVTNCVVRSNGGPGVTVVAGGSVTGCTIRTNIGPGIIATSNCLIAENNISSSTGAEGDGIRITASSNRIDGNTITGCSAAGIRTSVGGNFIVRNSARANSAGNYVITGTQTLGPIVFTTGIIADSVSPWANFSF